MEAITNAAEDYLIDGLSFKMAPGASYVTDRKSSTFWSVGSNAYTPTGGVKLLKFQLFLYSHFLYPKFLLLIIAVK
jgi:hypothetical protein